MQVGSLRQKVQTYTPKIDENGHCTTEKPAKLRSAVNEETMWKAEPPMINKKHIVNIIAKHTNTIQIDFFKSKQYKRKFQKQRLVEQMTDSDLVKVNNI